MKIKDEIDLSIESFLSSLTLNRQLSNHTVSSYQRDLSVLKQFIKGTPIHQLGMNDIRGLVTKMWASGLSSRSIARRLSAWRGFFSFIQPNKKNPCSGVKVPKGGKKLPSALSVDQAVFLVEGPENSTLSLRDHAMFELMYSCGLRLSELVNTEISDINRDNRTIRITGKGAKTRIIPVGKSAIKAIDKWLQVRMNIIKQTSDILFLSSRGSRITQRTVQRRLKALGQKKALDIPLHPHMLRHSFASHILQSSGDLRAVQELLGHENVKSTQIYSHLDWDHLSKVYDSAHPRAKIKKQKPNKKI